MYGPVVITIRVYWVPYYNNSKLFTIISKYFRNFLDPLSFRGYLRLKRIKFANRLENALQRIFRYDRSINLKEILN